MTIRSPRSLAAFAVTTTVALAMGISACSQTNNQGASEQLAYAKATLQSAAAEASTAASATVSAAQATAPSAANNAKETAQGVTGSTQTIVDSDVVVTVPEGVAHVVIFGSNVKLTSTHAIESITIGGSDNTVTLASVNRVSISGSSNTVTYSSGNPNVADTGADNSVSKG